MSEQELNSKFEPGSIQDKWEKTWTESNLYGDDASKNINPYCIVIPPPNVTGFLHMGHALNNTLQDIMIRYHRMNGQSALWVFGMDHAGIATQNVVERQLAAENKSRHDLGREKFIERVWQWREESGGGIRNQLKKLGASLDYDHERFTMDEGLSEAVLKVFVKLYKEGLIYRDKRLVNWDTKLHTAISDLEVEQKETNGHFWHFKYPLEDQSGFITIATTRPETMLGDTAIAVHPDDERYQSLIGKNAILPIVNRVIPIVGDDYADPESGSGAVKITPAHDFNDFEVGRRHQLAMINILNPDGTLNNEVPEDYRGLDRFEARKKIVTQMEDLGLLLEIEDHKHMVPHGDRSHSIIEPLLTDQWFVDAKTLAGPAIEAVESGKTKFVPQQWENTYFEWMRNIQPWCISRQIWWGHQIPAWYGPDEKIFVEENEALACAAAEKHYGKRVELKRDPDVLDTWFSSALWPFSTLGWPDENSELLKKYYPNSTLVTGFDIIFFWVARMMMMGLHFMKAVPFKEVYIHALVRDAQGQKMSKSKGNVMDPLLLMDKYGTDAFRFTLAAFAAQGRDIKLAEDRIEGYRNFCNKIWNAARFIMNAALPYAENTHGKIPESTHDEDLWILFELSLVTDKVRKNLDAYRFNDASMAIYHFFWDVFCSWYIEFIKSNLYGQDDAIKKQTATVAVYVLDQSLRLMHPFMPYISEELWQKLFDREGKFLTYEKFPESFSTDSLGKSHQRVEKLKAVVAKIRQIRMETELSPSLKIKAYLLSEHNLAEEFSSIEKRIVELAQLESLSYIQERPKEPVAKGVVGVDDILVFIPATGIIDIEKELSRQDKEMARIEKGLAAVSKMLSSPNFTDKAPPELVAQKEKEKADYLNRIEEIKEAKALLSSK